MKLYDLIENTLRKYPQTRDDDTKLIWVILGELGYIYNSTITKENFLKSPSFETIRRSRQKIQELNPDLDSSERVKKARKQIADQKGTHIFREEVTVNKRNSLLDDIMQM